MADHPPLPVAMTMPETSPKCPECREVVSNVQFPPLRCYNDECSNYGKPIQPTPTGEGSGRGTESANDRFERLADAFHTDTGMMAPGKDAPAALGSHDYDARVASWRAWLRGRTYGMEEAREAVEAARASVSTTPASESEAARDSERLTLMEQWATASAEASGYSEHAAEVEAWSVPQDDDDPCREWSVSGPRCKGYTIVGKGSSLREAIDDAQKRGREEGAVNAEVDRG